MRHGLRGIFEASSGFAVLGEAADGVEAVELTVRLDPDVVLMDLRMPGGGGVEAIAELSRRRGPDRAVAGHRRPAGLPGTGPGQRRAEQPGARCAAPGGEGLVQQVRQAGARASCQRAVSVYWCSQVIRSSATRHRWTNSAR
ncbi:response regulator [Nonomuraea sp. SBT364]|uniref:response regulator n=1 Tax=Nonomuraea sp. SBT364 TaxID=1580530 RepID=UPI002F3EE43D